MKQRFLPYCLLGAALLAFSGCSLAPEYHRPASPVSDSLAVSPQQGDAALTTAASTAFSEIGWREVFTESQLQHLIEKALENNRDLRVTALNLQEYQAQYRIRRAAQLPAVAGEGAASKARTLGGSSYVTAESYALGVGITAFELDFFGKVANLKDQALEQFLAMKETQKSATISLVAEVATAYLTWQADRELLVITEATEQVEAKSYALVQERLQGGIANELELAQARTSLESVRVNLAKYHRQVAQDVHYLMLLTGTASITEIAGNEAQLPGTISPLAALPDTLPSSLLLQRPDIVALEHQLKGANANIGAARAAFFPSISLTASAGVLSADVSGLFDGSSGVWQFAPTINLPIFTAGRLQAELDVAEIRQEALVASYEKAIQAAFREAADVLVGVSSYQEQLAAQEQNLAANEEYFRHAENRYELGVDSFLTLLDAQRSLYNSRQNWVSLRLAQLTNQVNLYKVLGGGWKIMTE